MKNTDTSQIHTACLRVAYREFFGNCPDASVIDKLTQEANENGQQGS